MSNDDVKKYTSITNYKALAVHLGRDKETVVADKEAGKLNIMDLESVVRYVCEAKGWFFSKDTTAATRPQVPPTSASWDTIDPDSPHNKLRDTVRWEVTDHDEKIEDPYLERAKTLKGR